MNILFNNIIMEDTKKLSDDIRDLRQPTNKLLLEETLLILNTIKRDVDACKSDLKIISQHISTKKREDELLKKGININPNKSDGSWWWWL